ncbi:MAG: non-canonical purine NTP pyrophosphatase, partial [Clostridia bacterium]|nr:non-canonical purine NTP pyrophosphatase [Clostridia bacterium]
MNLLIASNNSQKIKEIKSILKDRFDNIVSLKEAKINCDPEENGQTFYENALIKANEIAKHTSFAVLADDTGLCVNSLNGEPGVYSARYGGDHDNAKNRNKLLEKYQPTSDRSASLQ